MEGFDPVRDMRKFPRYPVDMRVKVSFDKGGVLQRATVKAIEIATHGISISSPVPLPENGHIELEIVLPDTRTPIRVKAIIRNKTGIRYGVEFLSTSDSQKDEITRFGNGRKPAAAVETCPTALPAAN